MSGARLISAMATSTRSTDSPDGISISHCSDRAGGRGTLPEVSDDHSTHGIHVWSGFSLAPVRNRIRSPSIVGETRYSPKRMGRENRADSLRKRPASSPPDPALENRSRALSQEDFAVADDADHLNGIDSREPGSPIGDKPPHLALETGPDEDPGSVPGDGRRHLPGEPMDTQKRPLGCQPHQLRGRGTAVDLGKIEAEARHPRW